MDSNEHLSQTPVPAGTSYVPRQVDSPTQGEYTPPIFGDIADTPSARPTVPLFGKGIAAMITGLCSLSFAGIFPIGLICAILGLRYAKVAYKAGNTTGFVRAGRITATLGLIFALISFVCMAGLFALYLVITFADPGPITYLPFEFLFSGS